METFLYKSSLPIANREKIDEILKNAASASETLRNAALFSENSTSKHLCIPVFHLFGPDSRADVLKMIRF